MAIMSIKLHALSFEVSSKNIHLLHLIHLIYTTTVYNISYTRYQVKHCNIPIMQRIVG